jgi:2-polyprenyl-3-methyl-5-hydroxy-6-metoxy-1,4-benzoquinol methylase
VKDTQDIERDEVSFFAKYYKDAAYNRTGSRLRFRRELSSLRRHLKGRAGNVLSIGCGDGEFEFMLSPYANRITALDLSQESIEIAKSRAEAHGVTNVDFRCQSLRDLQWDRPYDTVVCLALLHHVSPEELPAFLAGIYGSLVPGGLFYAEDPNVHGLLRRIGRLVLREKYHRYHSPDERELAPSEIEALCRTVGFRDVKIGYIDVTLIPSVYVVPRKLDWFHYPCLWTDWLWCHSPAARFASGFTTCAWK